MNHDQILVRVRKLLQLSKSDNPHEAAQAADRAAKLIAEHQLSEAQLRVSDETRAPERIITDHVVDNSTTKKVAWKSAIANAVAKSFGARMYWSGASILFFGRVSAVQAASYTTQYLWREVDRLADAEWTRAGYGSARGWKNAFRVGAAQTIAIRLAAQMTEAAKARLHTQTRVQTVEAEAPPLEEGMCAACNGELNVLGKLGNRTHYRCRDCGLESSQAPAETPPAPNPAALMLVERDAEEVRTEYAKFSKGFGKASPFGTVSNAGGFSHGVTAGKQIHLGGGRGALPAGAARLRGQ